MPRVKAGGLTPALWPPDTLRNASKQPRHMPRAKCAVPLPCPARSQAFQREAHWHHIWVCNPQMWWQAGRGAFGTHGRRGRLGISFQCARMWWQVGRPSSSSSAGTAHASSACASAASSCAPRTGEPLQEPCMQQRAQHRRAAHLPAALFKVLAAQLRAGRGRKLADAARQRRLADVHHRHHIALALFKACRGAGF